jgi:hydrogenase large subunit
MVLGLDLLRRGGPDAGVFTHYKIPKDLRHGTRFWGAARGYLSHHLTIEDQVIQSYQILGPSTFTMSPRDGSRTPGPCETAVVATPLLSTDNFPARFAGRRGDRRGQRVSQLMQRGKAEHRGMGAVGVAHT